MKGAIQPRLHRSQGNAEDLRRFGERVPQVVVQHDDGALVGCQAAESARQLVAHLNGLLGFGSGRARLIAQVDLERRQPAVASRRPVTIPDKDPLEPGVEAVDVAERSQILPGANECLLDDVLGEPAVTQDQPCGAVEPVRSAGRQRRERVEVAALRPGDQIPLDPSASMRCPSTSLGHRASDLFRAAIGEPIGTRGLRIDPNEVSRFRSGGNLMSRSSLTWISVALITIAAGACGGGTAAPSSPPIVSPTTAAVTSPPLPSAPATPSPTGVPSPSALPGLVGEWVRQTRCEEIVERLVSAGLGQWVLDNAAAFVPGAASGADLADPSSPCDGAVPIRHSHFFTDNGRFGSRDQDGNDVDDGMYRLIDDRTFVISKEFPDVTFHFTIEGDTIMFVPVIPACAPDCFEAAWSVTVAYEGLPWTRVAGN